MHTSRFALTPSCRRLRRQGKIRLLLTLSFLGLFFACHDTSPEASERFELFRNYPKDKALRNLQSLPKDDPEYLRSLISVELNNYLDYDNFQKSQRADYARLAEMRELVEKNPSPIRRGMVHLIYSGNAYGVDYYESYKEAREAVRYFEQVKDTRAMIAAYRNLAYRYRTSADVPQADNKEQNRIYKQKFLELCRMSRNPEQRANYYYTLLIDDTINSDVKRSDKLARTILQLAKEGHVEDYFNYPVQYKLTKVYFQHGLQDKVDSILDVRLKSSKPTILYRDIADFVVHSKYKDDEEKKEGIVKKAIASYKAHNVHDSRFLIDAYDYLEKEALHRGNYQKAHRYLALRDSVKFVENIDLAEARMANVEGSFKLEKKEEEVVRIEKEKTRLLLFFLFAGTLAVIAIVLGYRNYKSRKRIEELYERESDIKRVISHDVLSPLASLDMLVNRLIKLLPEEGEAIRTVRRQKHYIQNIEALCNNLVGWLWHGKSDAQKATDIRELLDTLRFELEGFMAAYGCDIRLVKSEASFPPIPDPNALRAILRNLLTNEVRHGQAKHIEIDCLQEPGHLIIVLRDDGFPLDEDLIGRLMEMLNAKSDGRSKTGLGLYLAGKFLKALKGHYSIRPSRVASFVNEHVVRIPT